MKLRVPITAPVWLLALALPLAGCASDRGYEPLAAPAAPAFQQEADLQRIRGLELENARLRADLEEAEQALVGVESGLLGNVTRAEAVARVAEARILLERRRADIAWQAPSFAEAAAKLDIAEAQLQDGHFAAAIFFASRGERIARLAEHEAELAQAEGSLRIAGNRVNVREQPSTGATVKTVLVRGTPVVPERSEDDWTLVRTPRGAIGWIHASLLE